ncbi:MAG: tRNA isopentenyl-2-thiomethyl-A-37 hydroxylase MiaE [Gammaproteobacteria bacterium]
MNTDDVNDLLAFLPCATPQAWIDYAVNHLEILLIDHAHCEKKAASTALSLIYRYPDRYALLHKLSRLAREELRHFEQVLVLIEQLGFRYDHVSPARYAAALRRHVRTHEPARLIDTLIVGALIEARSCERFMALAPHLPMPISQFYQRLLKSEARHFQDYLALAKNYATEDISLRIQALRQVEHDLILTPDAEFRFHSGIPLKVN